MFKKITLIASGLILCVSSMIGCSSSDSSSSSSSETSSSESTDTLGAKLQAIKDAGKLVIGTSADYPPFETHEITDDNDVIVGWDIDFAQQIANDLGVELEIKDVSFDTILTGLASGQFDIAIAGMGVTEERLAQFDASDPYYNTTNYLITTADKAASITSFADTKGLKIGGQNGSIQADVINEFFVPEGAILSDLKNVDDMIAALLSGSLDAVLLDSPVASEYVAENPGLQNSSLDLSQYEDFNEPKVLYLQKGQEDLLAFINQEITAHAANIYPTL